MEKALKELKELKSRMEMCNRLLDLQCSQIACVGASESALYLAGVYNGMEMLLSVLEGRKAQFCDISEVSESVDTGEPEKELEPEEKENNTRAISGIIK